MNVLAIYLAGFVLAVLRRRLAFWILVGVAVAYPQYMVDAEFNPSVPEWLSTLRLAEFCVGLGVGLIAASWRAGRSVRGLVGVVYGMAFALGVVGILRGNWINWVAMETLPWIGYVTIGAVCFIIRDERDLRRMLVWLFVLCSLASLGAVIEYVLEIGIATRYYVQGRSAKGMIGSFVALSLVLAAAADPDVRRHFRVPAKWLIPLLVINTAAAVVTINRMMLLCYPVLFAYYTARLLRDLRAVPRMAVVLVCVVASVSYLGAHFAISPALLGRFGDVPIEFDEHRRFELSLAESAFSSPDRLVFGSGAGQPWYRAWNDTLDFGNHDFLIQLTWKNGLVGLALFAWIAVFLVVRARARSRFLRGTGFGGVARWAHHMAFQFLFMSVGQNRFTSMKHTALIGAIVGLPFAIDTLATLGRRAQQPATRSEDVSDSRRFRAAHSRPLEWPR